MNWEDLWEKRGEWRIWRFWQKRAFFGVKWPITGSTKRHKKHKGCVCLWITARADASSKPSHAERVASTMGGGPWQGDSDAFARAVRGCFSRSRRGLGETLKGWTRDPIGVDPGPL